MSDDAGNPLTKEEIEEFEKRIAQRGIETALPDGDDKCRISKCRLVWYGAQGFARIRHFCGRKKV